MVDIDVAPFPKEVEPMLFVAVNLLFVPLFQFQDMDIEMVVQQQSVLAVIGLEVVMADLNTITPSWNYKPLIFRSDRRIQTRIGRPTVPNAAKITRFKGAGGTALT